MGRRAAGEITARVIEAEGFSDDQMAIKYPTRDRSVLWDRMEWARSYCKLAGALESVKRGLFLLSPLVREILGLGETDARKRLIELDRMVRAARPRRSRVADAVPEVPASPVDVEEEPDLEEDVAWTDTLLHRLHGLTRASFEEFSLYLLRQFGLELTRRGGVGDEGIDCIGTAPLSEVLSATVAVQVKRYDPTSTIGREVVALFQRDAAAVGAERSVLITLGRFSAPARKAATSATPRVDLIDGERLCELVRAKEVGVSLQPVVDERWCDRFEFAGGYAGAPPRRHVDNLAQFLTSREASEQGKCTALAHYLEMVT